jgi:hypothetical protein
VSSSIGDHTENYQHWCWSQLQHPRPANFWYLQSQLFLLLTLPLKISVLQEFLIDNAIAFIVTSLSWNQRSLGLGQSKW